MSSNLVMFDEPLDLSQAIAKLPDFDRALEWGVQSMTMPTVKSMILLAAGLSDHYRYALALTHDIAQYLYDMPDGAITSKQWFKRCDQVGSLIGHFDAMDVHVIQEGSDPACQGMMLLVLDDDHKAVGYILTRLREYSDHVVVNNILPKRT
ncbi:hypothetical protein D9M68_18550 [compost metagenome]